MCSICNCFAWTLDLFQRALTFCLSCWLAFAVCCGLLIAIIAGIAYGYNYCLAEFVTLTIDFVINVQDDYVIMQMLELGSDIRVYMRRGQFYDRPDLPHIKRRMGDDEEGVPFNFTNDYQQEEQSSDETALINKWMKDQDIRRYAEKLTKYSENRKTLSNVNDQAQQSKESFYTFKTLSDLHSFENSTISISLRHRESSDFIIRTFETLSHTEGSDSVQNDHNDAKVNRVLDRALAKTVHDEEENVKLVPSADIKSDLMKMRSWRTTLQPVIVDRSPDIEDNIVYTSI